MKKLVVGLVFIMFISLTSAVITLNEPSSVYNLGDKLYVSASGIVGADSGNLNINLICGNVTSNLVKISARAFDKDDTQTYSIPYKILNKEDLEISDISKIIGSCRVVASMGSQTVSTKDFTITDKISVLASVDKTGYDPGEQIQLTVKTERGDGAPFNGFFEVSNATEIFGATENGGSIKTFSTLENAKAGVYELDILAYDNYSGGILNKGETSVNFIINQVATSILPSISELEVTPEKELTLGADLFDQSGEKMNKLIDLEVVSPSGDSVKKNITSGDFVGFNFSSDAKPGIWKAVFSFSDLIVEKEFTMLEFQKAEFNILESTLTITNVGNAPYSKVVEIKIGDEVQILDELNIKIGESKQYSLKAPEGEYEIIVSDGKTSLSTITFLTGRAISIRDLESIGIFSNYSIIWIFLIVVIGATAFILFMRHKKAKTTSPRPSNNFSNSRQEEGLFSKIKNFFGRIFHGSKSAAAVTSKYKSGVGNSLLFTNKSPAAHSLDSKMQNVEDESMVDLTNRGASGAESALVMKGEKHKSAVIAISIRNSEALTESSREELSRIINKAKISKGLIDWRGSHIFVIFSPLITRTYGNEILASRAALKMFEDFSNHNRKFKDKIEFNIGVHAGDLVASKENNRLKYTGIGNTIALAKRMSDSDNEKMIVSEEIRKKMLRDMRAIKSHEINKHQTYSVIGIRNKEADKEKLRDLLDRMEKG